MCVGNAVDQPHEDRPPKTPPTTTGPPVPTRSTPASGPTTTGAPRHPGSSVSQPSSPATAGGLRRGEQRHDDGDDDGDDDEDDTAMSQSVSFVPRKRRNVELVLVLMALAIGIAAYAIIGLATANQVPADIFRMVAGSPLLGIACHVVVRWRPRTPTRCCCRCVVALNGIGLAMIHRIDLAGSTPTARAHTYADAQLIWMTVGVVLFVARAGRPAGPPPAAGVHLHRRASSASCCCCCR